MEKNWKINNHGGGGTTIIRDSRVTPFNKIAESSRAWTIECHLVLHLKLLKLLLAEQRTKDNQNHEFSFEFQHLLLMQQLLFLMDQKYFFPMELLLSFNGPANLLNNEPKNPPDWIALDIWTLESFISVHILFWNRFLNFALWLVVSNDSCGKLSPLSIFKPTLKVVPALFLFAVFSLFSCESVNFTFTVFNHLYVVTILLLFL